MNKKSLGWFILKLTIFGQLVMIVVGALLVAFAGYEAKFTIKYFAVASIIYWAIFGKLAYLYRNWVRVDEENK